MPVPQYIASSIAPLVHGKLVQHQHDEPISSLVLDTRKIASSGHGLFFAIKGKRHDGHLFIQEAYNTGIRDFVVTEEKQYDLPEANIILVADSIKAMQVLVADHRKQFKIPVIGITGSNGKTIVKEWLHQLLDQDHQIIRSPKSFNSQVGVPLSVWPMSNEHSLGIFEAGISEPDEMEHLEKVIQPTIGVFTNIGDAHAEGFLNIKHKIREKLRLFINSKILIYGKDYPDITLALDEIKQHLNQDDDEEELKKFKTFTWSRKVKDADLYVDLIEKTDAFTTLSGWFREERLVVSIPFIDEASVENAITCWVVLLYMGLDKQVIEERMWNLGRVAMRLELKDGIHNSSLINDSYNSDLGSLTIALDFLDLQQQHDKKTLILSDILQSSKNEHELYEAVCELIKGRSVARLLGIGEAISRNQHIFKSLPDLETHFYQDTDSFLAELSSIPFQEEAILLKGARKFAFERISNALEQKVHETVLEINLNALAHNLQVYNSLLDADTKMMVMVKAFSYGSGSFEVANVLQFNRVDYLAVAYADEGVALRKAGITLPIMVMNPEVNSFDTIITYQLEPEIYSFSLLERFVAALELSRKEDRPPFPVHIKLDTGMHRLGFEDKDVKTLSKMLKVNTFIKVSSVFSHLAASEAKVHDDFTREQLNRFKKMSKVLVKALDYPVMCHIANSAAIARMPQARLDMVRLGLGLYGIDLTGKLSGQLQTVGTLRSTISQIKKVRKGDTIGYSRQGKATKAMQIATVGIGYADGIDRRLGNGKGKMLINGKRAPIVGNVCMDMCMLDITGIKGVSEGDEVIVFGKDITVEELADWVGTIPYEVLTGISERVKRVYFQE